MNPLKGLLCCIILWLISIDATFAQRGYLVDKDNRIAKFEKDILLCLIQQDELTKKADSIKLDDYQGLFIVRKQLELFSYNPAANLLLIQFRSNSDDGSTFWGILTDNEHYFFLDTGDLGEVDFVRFKKKYDQKIVATITFYCDQPDFRSIGGSLAFEIYYDKLTFVKYFLHNEYGVDKKKAISAAYFLENITAIKSGRYSKSSEPNLTEQDYTNWREWLRHNSLRLYWDDKEKKVKVKK